VPIYQCYSPQRLITKSDKGKIAAEITRIHCEVTGERPAFVNVLFLDTPRGTSFTAGQPSTRSFVMGEIRHGRDVHARHALLRNLSQMWTQHTNQSEAELIVALRETPAENATQAGLIFAEPGDEQRWYDENRTKLTEFGLL
jgi:phenylpyruvate tautomerase PptA (4-oxalocrotonate tautomerase family)